MSVRIGFSKSNSVPSRLIRWATHGNISHTYVRFYVEEYNVWMILHADWPGVMLEDAQSYDSENQIVVEYEVSHPKTKEIVKESMKFLKRKYNYFMLLKWAWYLWRKKPKEQILDLVPDNPKSLICVELATFFIKKLAPKVPCMKLNPYELEIWINIHHEEFGWRKYVPFN